MQSSPVKRAGAGNFPILPWELHCPIWVGLQVQDTGREQGCGALAKGGGGSHTQARKLQGLTVGQVQPEPGRALDPRHRPAGLLLDKQWLLSVGLLQCHSPVWQS